MCFPIANVYSETLVENILQCNLEQCTLGVFVQKLQK